MGEMLNGAENAKNTIIRHGAPSEYKLMEVLGGHDGEIKLAGLKKMRWKGAGT